MSLEFSLNQTAPTAATVDCVVAGLFADGSLTLEALDELVRDCQQSVERLADQARAAAPGSADDVTPPVTRNTGRS